MEIIRLEQTAETAKYFCVNWAITTVCNYRCRYCHPSLHDGKINHVPFDKMVDFITEIFSMCKERNLTPYFEFGGGEVTYLPWFSKIIALINKSGGLTTIISNGSSPVKWWVKNTPLIYCVCLSYHCENAKSLKHFINVAKIVSVSPVTKLHINMMMLPDKFYHCLDIALQLRKEVACSIALQPLYHGFGGGIITGRFSYTECQGKIMSEFVGGDSLKKLPTPRGEVNVISSCGKVTKKSCFELLVNQKTNFKGWKCNAGIENIVVSAAGDIYRGWCMQDPSIGNLHDGNLILPDMPTICRTEVCQCGPDICSGKSKI